MHAEVPGFMDGLRLRRGVYLAWLALVWVATSAAAPRYTNSWAVEIKGGAEAADQLAWKHRFVNHGQIGNLQDYYHFSLVEFSHGPKQLIDLQSPKTAALADEEQVGFVEQQVTRERVRKSYIPPCDPNWPNQWALFNTGQTDGPAGLDLNVERAWMQGVTGEGVVVSFVDDGLEMRHPDLKLNFDLTASWDFVDNDNDPTPDYSTNEPNSHGTSCAGEVGMARDNGVCGAGVAYDCNIGGIKVDLSTGTDLSEASYLSYRTDYIHIKSNSWGASDYGHTVDGPGYILKQAMEVAVREGRDGKGSIFTFAAGNGGEYYDSCAADGYTNSIYTISVGSADQNGYQADYDEDCSAKMVVTYSHNSDTFPTYDDDPDAYNQISTTTTNGRCDDSFTGTSASTPLVSGVLALTLQANPKLTWRDVQYLLAYTSNRDGLQPNSAWVTNGAGLRVSQKFGFGAIDAEAMVTRARRWSTVPEQHSYNFAPTVPQGSNYSSINNPLVLTFSISENDFNSNNSVGFLEHVVIQMSLEVRGYETCYNYNDFYEYVYNYYYHNQERREVDSDFEYFGNPDDWGVQKRDIYDWLGNEHTKRGDIKISLTSPQGTSSILLPYRKYDFVNQVGYHNWPFMSVHFWGENPVGTWTLTVQFKSGSGYVEMTNLNVTVFGTAETPEAVSSIPRSCDSTCAGACSGTGAESCDTCRDFRVASTLECSTECPKGTYGYKKYCFLGDSERVNSSACIEQPSSTLPGTSKTQIAMPVSATWTETGDSTTAFSHLVSSVLRSGTLTADHPPSTSQMNLHPGTTSAPAQSSQPISTTHPPISQSHAELSTTPLLQTSHLLPPSPHVESSGHQAITPTITKSPPFAGMSHTKVYPQSSAVLPPPSESKPPMSIPVTASQPTSFAGMSHTKVYPQFSSMLPPPSESRPPMSIPVTASQPTPFAGMSYTKAYPQSSAVQLPPSESRPGALPSPTQNQTERQGGSNHGSQENHDEGIISGVLVSLFVLFVVILSIGVVTYVCYKKRKKQQIIDFIPLSTIQEDNDMPQEDNDMPHATLIMEDIL